jgi:DNA-binding CsgD family transcriptional regulator
MIYIMSEDWFFAEGVANLFKEEGQQIGVLPFSPQNYMVEIERLQYGDTLLLAIEYFDLIGNIIRHLANRAIRFCLFLDNIGNYCQQTFKENGVIPKNIMPQHLIPAISKTLNNGGLVFLAEKLTPAERHIMDRLSSGMRPDGIASELNISVKTVCAHKKNSLARIGLPAMNSKALVIYSCANAARLLPAAKGHSLQVASL